MVKLGTEKKPAIVRVRTQAKAAEILTLCNKHGWKVVVGIEPGKPEDITDIKRLLGHNISMTEKPKVGRNDPCPCGSGKKYKKCCLKKSG